MQVNIIPNCPNFAKLWEEEEERLDNLVLDAGRCEQEAGERACRDEYESRTLEKAEW